MIDMTTTFFLIWITILFVGWLIYCCLLVWWRKRKAKKELAEK